MPNVNVRSSFSSRVLLSSALAVLAVSGALTYAAIHSATNIESQAIEYPKPTPTPTLTPTPTVKLAEFQVCAAARGQCANCHFFIPDSPPGCGGLMGSNPPLKSPTPGTLNPHTGKPTPGRNRNPQSEQTYDHIWQAHPGAGPIVSTTAFLTHKDIPLPTCFPCPPSQNVLSSVTTEVNTRSWWMDLSDEKNNRMLGVTELVR